MAPEIPHRARPPSGRDSYFDNAKFLLVVLVVAGHSWAPLVEELRAVKAAYLFVYAFHMPLFVLVCGYFSRGFTGTPAQIRKLVTGVLLPYLLFEAVYAGMYTLVWDEPFSVTPTEPRYLTWFLLALFLWRVTAIVWRAVRHPVAVAVLISLAAGLTRVGDELALPRLLQFLPWFVLGLRLRPEHFRPLRTLLARRLSVLTVLGGAVAAYVLAPRVSTGWLLAADSGELGVSAGRYLLVRLALFGVTAALGAAFLALVPAHTTVFTLLGAVTLYPYLLHGLLVKSLQGAGGYDLVERGGPAAAVLLTLVAAVVAVLLCAVPLRRAVGPLVEPRLPGWLWRTQTPPAGQAEPGPEPRSESWPGPEHTGALAPTQAPTHAPAAAPEPADAESGPEPADAYVRARPPEPEPAPATGPLPVPHPPWAPSEAR